jgi:dihydrofolate reductase
MGSGRGPGRGRHGGCPPQGLVDEIVLAVYPVLLGRGKRCFPESADPSAFTLVRSKATPTGNLLNVYRHVASVGT